MPSAEQATRYWLETIVIGQNFCPFAQKPFVQDSIRFATLSSADPVQMLAFVQAEAKRLIDTPDIETTLCIFDTTQLSFYDYLDLVDLANHALYEAELEGVLQIATFHPEYVFAGESKDAPSHFTNRAPYPIIHLLREASLSKVLDNMPESHTISEDNIARATQLGIEFFQTHLERAHDVAT